MIEVKGLVKRFGSLRAVDDLSFKVVQGEILGFLGPNGAGKSTTMKLITGFLTPDAGEVSIYGHDIEADTIDAQRQIGYLPEGAPCYEEMTPPDFLDFIAQARGIPAAERPAAVRRVVETMSLGSVLNQRIETLSKGFKRRVGLAQAIIHDPKVLILDEPTDGLDPNQKHQVREMIRGLSRDKIVIISTHILEEVTAVCTRAIIIASGALVSDSTPSELEAQSKYHGAVTVRLADPGKDLAALNEAMHGVASAGGFATEDDGSFVAFPADGATSLLADVNGVLQSNNIAVSSVQVERGRLDEVFRNVTGGA